MRAEITIGLLALLVGCANQNVPPLGTASDWQDYGSERANSGNTKQSETQLKALDSLSTLNKDTLSAYDKGYEQGRAEYCRQSAYILGMKGIMYNGICDQLDWTFREDYVSGRKSSAGSMY
ncbi:DUF2799 domain-containing protein [Photobacterium indicum]|uniref:DUF2799 domain-containing protein n=1 Tax=Photobacterium indicum TaxID=81447 RepID=UPI003D1533F7